MAGTDQGHDRGGDPTGGYPAYERHPRNVRKPGHWEADTMIPGREYGLIIAANVGYARVSTIEQDPNAATRALGAARRVELFEDLRSTGLIVPGCSLHSTLTMLLLFAGSDCPHPTIPT
jgi:hypothetical protein